MGALELNGVEKVYAGGVRAVADLDLHVRDGELLVLLGPSGCGKSTILELVAGLEPLTSGEIRIGGRRVDGEPPDRRDVAMVFQSYALYGHMSVRENIEFPLRMRGVGRTERRRRAVDIASLLQLEAVLDARPAALSGGQQQRVAMGRALVRRPAAFLLDEPLSNLDARLRTQLREEIGRIQRRLGVTTLHVTHDQVEALSLGDRVAVLRAGRLQQIGSGQELYDRPANTFVAAFLGQPGMNLLRGTLREGDDAPTLGGRTDGRAVIVGIRPEDARPCSPEEAELTGTVRLVEDLGSERVVHMDVPVPLVGERDQDTAASEARPAAPLFAVRIERHRPTPRVEDVVHVALRPDRVRLFDHDGRALRPGGPRSAAAEVGLP